MAAEGSNDFFSGVTDTQPKGPLFADDGGCRCALQEALDRESWRCIANTTSNIYSGQTGKWFLAVNQANPASLQESTNSDSNPPNVSTPYVIRGEGQNPEFVDISSTTDTTALGDMTCSGKNDTEASSTLYKYIAESTELLSQCWQPGTTPLIIQNASQWIATGCNLGFLCKCASLYASESLQKVTDCSIHHRPE